MVRDPYGDEGKMENPSLFGKNIVAVRKNDQGDLLEFKLASGQVVSYDQAISVIESGQSSSLLVQRGNDGEKIIRSKPDAHSENNLDMLESY